MVLYIIINIRGTRGYYLLYRHAIISMPWCAFLGKRIAELDLDQEMPGGVKRRHAGHAWHMMIVLLI